MDTDEKTKFYWNTRQIRQTCLPQGFFYNQVKLRAILSFLLKYNFDKKRILSVGDGFGFFTYIVRLLWEDVYCMSTDIAEAGTQRAKEIFNLPSKTCDCSDLPFSEGSFDIILALDVLEHVDLEKRKKFYAEASRVLDRYGYIVIDIPVTRDYHWEAAQFRTDPHEIAVGLSLEGFEIYEQDFYEKKWGRKSCLIIARRYHQDCWWIENPQDPGYRVHANDKSKKI